MSSAKTQHEWTENQLKYIGFVARGKTDRTGAPFTEEEFGKAIGVDRVTLWRWRQLDGFPEALFEASLRELSTHLPSLNAAMVGKAAGNSKYKNASEKAYLALMRQYELLKSDKIDHTTNGKDMPMPILGDMLLQPQAEASK